MANTETRVQSGSLIEGAFAPVNIMEIGDQSQPTDLIIYNGRMMVMSASGQTTIQGGVVQSVGIAARAVTAEKLTVSERGYIHNIPFDPVTRNKVDWGTGKIYFTGGNEVTVTAGSTGGLSSEAYVYYDGQANNLRTTPSLDVAVAGTNVPMIKVVPQDSTTERAVIQDFRGGRTTISGDQIVTGKIGADRIWVGLQSFATNVQFIPDGADKLDWIAGTLKTVDENEHIVSASTTGNVNKNTSAFSSDGDTIGLWHFDETSGTAVDNAEGTAALDGTASGTNITSDGRYSYTRYFNGSSDYVSVPDNASLDLTTFSIEGSIKTRDRGGVVLGRVATAGTSWPYRILIDDSGYLQFDVKPGISTSYILESQTRVDDYVWHDFVATFDATANEMQLWVDGIRHGFRENCFSDPPASSEALQFGRSGQGAGTSYFKGYIDEVRISDWVRSYTAEQKRYIYWNGSKNLQVSTDYTDAVGTERILLAIMTPKQTFGSCEVQLFGNDGTIIDGDKIQTGRISSADGKTYFDLNERRIIMNDGIHDRLILGYHPSRFNTN